MKFFKLDVAAINNDTEFSVIIEFNLPDNIKSHFNYKAGQYVTLIMPETDERRSYSICTAPHENKLMIGVKKVENGKVSHFLTEELKVGDTLEISQPEGNFNYVPKPEISMVHYFIAAGSGITPILAMIKEILEKEPLSSVNLLYGNKTEKHIMFYEEIGKLSADYQGQFHVQFIFSKENRAVNYKYNSINQPSIGKGRIDSSILKKWLSLRPAYGAQSHFYICGPGMMIQGIENALTILGVPKESIKMEYFNPPQSHDNNTVSSSPKEAHVVVHLDGDRIQFKLNNKVTILEALEDLGYDPPYSCLNGTCSSCVGRVLSGNVRMETNLALSESDLKEGYILTCQSYIDSPEIELVYE